MRETAAQQSATREWLGRLSSGQAAIPGQAGESRMVNGEELWFPPTTLAGVTVTPESALTLTAVFAAINVIATDSATLDLSCYKHLPGGGKTLAPENPVHDLVHFTPDDGETTSVQFRQAVMGHTLGWGNGYAEIVRKGNGRPHSLHLLDPSTTRPFNGPNGKVAYKTQVNNVHKVIPGADVLHIAGLGFNGVLGYSPAFMARQAIALGLAAEAFGATFFGNNTVASGYLETPRKLKPEAVQNLRDSIGSIHQGPYNAHKMMILEEGMKFVKNSVDPEDAQFLLTRKFQVIEIARMYRVPPHKLMDYSEAHLANVEESNLDYLMTSLLPWLVLIEAQFNMKLFTRAERAQYFVEHNMDTFLRGNMAGLATYFKELFGMGAFSTNDILRKLRMNPIGPEGDVRFVSTNLISLLNAGKSPVPAAEPTREAA